MMIGHGEGGGVSLGAVVRPVPFGPIADPGRLEANHRIANSLQLLSALLASQGREVCDPVARRALETSVQRIAAIAGVHRQLYLSDDRHGLDVRVYLADLIAGLRESFCGEGRRRHILLEAESVRVPCEFATNLGVVVTELIINACKYAYADDQPGDIRIMLRTDRSGRFDLEVRDDGKGRPADAVGARGMGARILELMARRLGTEGGYAERADGTSFRMAGRIPPL
jgi:two-component sensor histidine kinase